MAGCRKQLFVSRRVVLESGVMDGAVLVEAGVVAAVLTRAQAERLLADACETIQVEDGGSLALLAGAVDSHVHVNEPGRTAWEGFRSATAAAAAGGVTTVVDMPLNSIPPTTTVENLKIKASSARDNIYVDVGFWGGVIPGNQGSLRDLVSAGVVGFKCFLCPSGVEEFPRVTRPDLEAAFRALEGTGTVLAFHAELEDENSTTNVTSDPQEYATYLASRPPEMELNAVSFINTLLPKTDVRVHIVHVSSARVVPLLAAARAARAAGAAGGAGVGWRGGVTAETCHHYLTFAAEEVPRGHTEYKCAPPVREDSNKEELWRHLLAGELDLVVSDHSPCTPDLKAGDMLQAWGGIASVQFGLSIFWSAAEARGLGLADVSRLMALGPARLCGLRHKGAIRQGYHADLVFFDPDSTFVVEEHMILHKNKLTPYLGKTLKGIVKKTFLRGQLIYSDGEVIPDPKGSLLLKESF